MPRLSPYRADERLNDWMPSPAVRTHHRRSSAASPEALWDAARAVRLADTRTLARLVRWRIPGVPEGQTFDELFRAYPFTLLDAGDTWSVSGLCGRIWTLARDYPRLSGPEEFRGWDQRGTVRVLFAHWAEPAEGGRAALGRGDPAPPVGAPARARLRALWTVIGPFERIVGAEPLAVAALRAARGGRSGVLGSGWRRKDGRR